MSEISDMAEVLVPLHRLAVEKTVNLLFERLDLPADQRLPTLIRARGFYDRIPMGQGLLTCHEEPFDSACDFMVEPIPYDDRLRVFERIRAAYESIMSDLDEVADRELREKRNPNQGLALI